jgi:hypothetical protein
MSWNDFNTESNLNLIQSQIQQVILATYKISIPPQNSGDLMNLMRAVYQTNPLLTRQQINQRVVDVAVEKIGPNLRMNQFFKSQVNGRGGWIQPPHPLPLPVNASASGTRIQPQNTPRQ